MTELMTALMLWISANTAYETAGLPLPELVEMTPAELTAEYYTDVPHLIPSQGIDTRVQALYSQQDGPHGRVYVLAAHLVEGADQDDDPYSNPAFREMVLHELIHHVQFQTGTTETYLCPAQGEAEAYAAGGLYLRQRNAPDPLPNRNFWGHVYSRC
ncbi:hypothetical protein [Dinoroseobacter sp. S375]|uniref:hypothetical protein n=1 Tax=Dinoroseobacter sp. S375 TaxID=3415136 RepID=UPI003C7E8C46